MRGISTTQIVTIPETFATLGDRIGRRGGRKLPVRARIAALTAALTGLAALAGCSGRPAAAADAAFAAGMVPHHEMGIRLDELAVAGADDVRVRRLAFEMNTYQGPELDQLRAWSRSWAGLAGDAMAHGAHTDADPVGMPSDADLDRLRTSRGRTFDALFLTLMITHHEGAVTMAHREQAGGTDRRAVAMAGQIVAVQERQLATMRSLLAELSPGWQPGADPVALR